MQKEVAHGTPRAAPPQPKSQARRREGCEDIAKKTFADLGLLCVFALWLARTDAFRKLVPRTSHYRGEPCSKNTLLNYSNTENTEEKMQCAGISGAKGPHHSLNEFSFLQCFATR